MAKKQKIEHGNGACLDDAVDIFLQGAGKISSALLGMINKVGGQIYALLFLADEPLSLDEIAERLSVSKSNVSINIRLLEEYDLVEASARRALEGPLAAEASEILDKAEDARTHP